MAKTQRGQTCTGVCRTVNGTAVVGWVVNGMKLHPPTGKAHGQIQIKNEDSESYLLSSSNQHES